ncbi:MAG: rod shape-determining protein MreD [Bacillales bacterium]|nr:rod shape-determining protein MreD [Bacillales bacterium]
MIRYVALPLIFLFLFIMESVFLFFVPSYGQINDYMIVPHFLFISFVFSAMYYQRNTTLIYAFIFGAIFDIFYTSLLGVYAYLFPLTVYLVCKVMQPLYKKLAIIFVFTLTGIIFIEFLVFGIQSAVGKSSIGIEEFMYNRLWPTLVINIVFLLLFSYGLKKNFVKFYKIEDK